MVLLARSCLSIILLLPSKFKRVETFTMRASSSQKVRDMYEASAQDYNSMMDTEIQLPVYSDTFRRLSENLMDIQGPLIDTSCGSGHMLELYHKNFDKDRLLLGFDLSPRMVQIATSRLGDTAQVAIGDMCSLSTVLDNTVAGVVSFFALHHLDPDRVQAAFREWRRVLKPNGQLVVAAWEGEGQLDYGDSCSVVALRYKKENLCAWAEAASLAVTRCVVQTIEEMGMDAIYLDAKAT